MLLDRYTVSIKMVRNFQEAAPEKNSIITTDLIKGTKLFLQLVKPWYKGGRVLAQIIVFCQELLQRNFKVTGVVKTSHRKYALYYMQQMEVL
jgi:hypothetical protein